MKHFLQRLTGLVKGTLALRCSRGKNQPRTQKGEMTERLTIGQRVVHRRYGAGVVVEVRQGKEDEEHESYYVIDIPSSALKVYLPVSAAQQANLRRVSSRRRMNHALKILSGDPEELPKDYRERGSFVQELMKDGVVDSLAQVIRDLVALQSRKSMSSMELALVTNAKRRLAGELALVLDIDLAQAEQRIENALRRDEVE